MQYNFDEIIDRSGTYSVKLEALPEGAPEDALSVWIADMDFPCAQPIIQALHDRIDRRIFGYSLYESEELSNAVINWYKKQYDWDVKKEDVFFSPGVVPALAFLIHILSQEGDGIIIQKPVYYPFTSKILGAKRKIVNNPLIYEDGRYRMDYEDLEKKLADENNRGLILCNPHNPVGRVWTEEELKKLVLLAQKYGKWIISDEIHADLTRAGIHYTPLAKVVPEYADHIAVCTAPTKTFNLAGVQLSNIVISNKEWQQKWLDIIDGEFSVAVANPFGIEATIAAYTKGEEWLEQVKAYIDGNIQYVKDFVKEHMPKAHVVDTEGTYLMWIDMNGYETDVKKLEHLMQHTAKIAFDEGYIFGEEGNGFERLNIATSRRNVEECMRRMLAAVETL